jgi:hypothetical protein
MGHACSSVICTLKLCLVMGVCSAATRELASNQLAAGSLVFERSTFCALRCGLRASMKPIFSRLTSDQVGIPAELKHINKRRKRNQQGLP